jgi:hypothetical protein
VKGMADEVTKLPKKIHMLKAVKVVEPPFAVTRVIGNIGKELVRALLESCGYTVYPFGYESYFTHVKDLMHTGKLRKFAQLQRMPDLLVIDEDKREIRLVEVITQTRKNSTDASIDKKKLDELKKFWPDSILVAVLPKDESVFYAEKVTDLKITDPNFVNFDISESPITKWFSKTKDCEVLNELLELCRSIFKEVSGSLKIVIQEE